MSYTSDARDVLMAWLTERAESGRPLPRLCWIADHLGIGTSNTVDRCLRSAAHMGLIRYWHGTRTYCRGEQTIMILATGPRIRSAGCPAGVDPVDPQHREAA